MGQVEVTADNYTPEAGESASETARNIANLLKTSDDSGEESKGEEEEPTSEEGNTEGDKTEEQVAEDAAKSARQRDESGKFVKGQKEAAKLQKTNDPELQPPTILAPHAKKAFLNLPEGLKRETHRLIKGIQASGTRAQQDLAKSLEHSEAIRIPAENYISNNNITDPKGVPYTPAQLFNDLMSAHTNLSRDPDRYIAQMIVQMEANPQNITAYLQGKNPSGVDITKDPHFRALQTEHEQLKNKLSEREQSEASQRQAPLADAFAEVMREIDPASGNFKYIELHEKAFSDSTKPIVAALLRTGRYTPQQALIKAWATLTGNEEHSQNGNQPILPTKQPVNYNDRAKQAAVSVRGKIAPTGAGQSNSADLELHEIPSSPTETARLILSRLSAGG